MHISCPPPEFVSGVLTYEQISSFHTIIEYRNQEPPIVQKKVEHFGSHTRVNYGSGAGEY